MRERGAGGGTRGSSAVSRRDRPEVPEPPRRLYSGSEVAPRIALRRRSEAVPTKPRRRTPAILRAAKAAARRGGRAERVKGVWGDVPPWPTGRSPRGKRRRIRRLAARPAAPPLSRGARERAKTGLAVSRDGRAARGRAAAGRRAKPVLRLSRPRARHAGRRQRRGDTAVARGKEACMPRAIPRGAQADAGAQCPPATCGRAPRSGWVDRGGPLRNCNRRPSADGNRNPERSRASPPAILRACAASVLLRAYPPD